jgi:chromate transporter
MSARGWLIAALLGAALVMLPRLWSPALSQLSLSFMKIGVLAFGGGFAMIPLIQQEVVVRLGWMTTREFMDGIAMGQVTPGPIVITAAFVGYRVGGLVGAIASTLAVFYPSFLVLIGLIHHFDRIRRLDAVQWAIRGVLAAFIALLVFTVWQFARASLIDWQSWVLAVAALVALRMRVGLPLVLGGAAVLSVIFSS